MDSDVKPQSVTQMQPASQREILPYKLYGKISPCKATQYDWAA